MTDVAPSTGHPAMSPDKQALLERLLKGEEASSPPLERLDRDQPLPLSSGQQRLWFLHQLDPDSIQYNVPAPLLLAGELDRAALTAALSQLVARHETLRTTFAAHDGMAYQRVHPPALAELPFVDLAGHPDPRAEAERLATEQARWPFDLKNGPLLRALLIRVAADEHVLALTTHHIVGDGWSARILQRDLAQLYTANVSGDPAGLPELPVQYADYAAWQLGRLDKGSMDRQLSYWRTQLADAPVLDLPTDRPRPAVRNADAGDTVSFTIEAETADALRRLAHAHDATMFMTMLAAFQALLARYSGQDDVVVGTPVAGRDHPDAEDLIGFFVNMLVVRTRLDDDPGFAELLDRVRSTCLAAYTHEGVPFERIVDVAPPTRDRSRNPLFDVLFTYVGASGGQPDDEPAGGLQMGAFASCHTVAKFDLSLTIAERGTQLAGLFELSVELFDRATVEQLADHFVRLLTAVSADWERPLSELDLMTADERDHVVAGLNPAAETCPETPVHELFAEQARATPDAVAVVAEDGSLTYDELDTLANRLAHRLRTNGLAAEEPVGILLERGARLPAAVLAVLKAGGAYLPFDPSSPPDRLEHMLAVARATTVIVSGAEAPPVLRSVRLVRIDDQQALSRCPATPPVVRTHPDQLAYVLFTSGSTGRPKGAGNTHRALTNRLAWMVTAGLLQPGDRVAHKTPIGFDVSVWEAIGPLTCGATIVMARPGGHRDPEYLARLFDESGVTVTHFVPSMLRAFVEEPLVRDCHALDRVICSGEALPAHLVSALTKKCPVQIHNLYGPTEAAIDVTWWACPPNPDVMVIGRPVPGTRLYVLDPRLRPTPVGVAGELYIAGVQVARGYVGRADLTAERFVPDPAAADGSRLYRTGDRVRWRRDGTLEYLGRLDDQIKVRGFRVEPGEVEAALVKVEGIDEVAVTSYKEQEPGDERLVAYLVSADQSAPIDTPVLRERLRTNLPDYMIPASYVWLDRLPLTANGKLDRRSLPRPDMGAERTDVAPPRNQVEQVLASIFADVLNAAAVGVHDDFFDLGGHSLLATRVVARVRTAFETDVRVAALFDHPTVAGFAAAIAAEQQPALPPITRVDRDRPLPLSAAQQRLWFLSQMEPAAAEYNVPITLRLTGDLSVDALTQALTAVVTRHEVLRTRFVAIKGEPWQVVDPPGPVELPVLDVRGHAEPWDETYRLLSDAARRPFDLAVGALRGLLIRAADNEHVLALTLHHIVTDEWSAGLLRKELAVHYDAALRGTDAELAAPAVQYGDYAAWQQSWLTSSATDEQLAYWREQLDDLTPLDLPTDHPRPATRDPHHAATHHLTIPAALTRRLHRLAHAHHATPYMTVLAAVHALLAHYTGQTDIATGTPIAGRTHAQTHDLIGCFINTVVIRTHLDDDPTFSQLLAQTRTTCLGAYAHQDTPFEHLVSHLAPPRNRSRNPLFDVFFAYVTPHGGEDRLALDGVQVSGCDPGHTVAQFDLSLTIADHGDELSGTVEYSTDLFEPHTIERFGRHLVRLLEQVVADPDRRLSRLELVDDAERDQLAELNPAPVPVREEPVHELVGAHAQSTPDAVAVVADDRQLTYRQLETAANRLAHHLTALGAGPETVVAVCLARSIAIPIAILGVLKAGAAYLPLDPADPSHRHTQLLGDTTIVITDRALASRLGKQAGGDLQLVALDDPALRGYPDTPPRTRVHPDQAAYLIYTSGSTGRPKATIATHHNLQQLNAAWRTIYRNDPHRWLNLTSVAFDVFTGDLLRALAAGGTLHIAPSGLATNPVALAGYLEDHHITAVEAGPAVLTPLVEQLQHATTPLPALRLLVMTTDVVHGALLNRLTALLPHTTVRTAYGLTETSIDSTQLDTRELDDMPADARVPIGRPLPGTRIHLLTSYLARTAIGPTGHLYIGGSALTRGYLGRPDLTAERYVPDPDANDGTRMYRTGDLARWRSSGTLDFLGRADQQINLYGHRIEPAEIQHVLIAHPTLAAYTITAAAITTHTHQSPTGATDVRLTAYLVAGTAVDPVRLRRSLHTLLPHHMVPGHIVQIDRLPLTANGKVDYTRLPPPTTPAADAVSAHHPPADPLEELLVTLWANVLRTTHAISTDDSFFDLGGHSLLATQLIARVNTTLGTNLPITAVFDHPTIRQLGAYISSHHTTASPPPITVRQPETQAPLTHSQQRLWFLHQLEPQSTEYNVPAPIRLTGEIDRAAIAAALSDVVARHEVLRTTFPALDGVPWQRVNRAEPLEVPLVDVSDHRDAAAEAVRRVRAQADQPFDLENGPVLRAELVRVAADDHVLNLTMHHIVCDEWSAGLFRDEFAGHYAAAVRGEPAALARPEIQYADYAAWQHTWLTDDTLSTHLGYWRDQLADLPTLDLPTDRPRPAVRDPHRAGVLTFAVPSTTASRLRGLARAHDSTMFMTGLAAFQTLLARYSGQQDVAIGTPIAGRTDAATEKLIGFFVNTLVIRTRLHDDPSFADLLARVRTTCLDAYRHQDVPFERIVDELRPARDRSRNPLFDVLFTYETTAPDGTVALPGATAGGLPGCHVVAQFDLSLTMTESGGELGGRVEFSSELFDEPTVKQLVRHLCRLFDLLTDHPDQALSALDIVDAAERATLSGFEPHQVAVPARSFAELVAGQAATSPAKVAVVAEDGELTYGALDSAANKVARHLGTLGVGPDTVVGISLSRSTDLVVAILGVLKAGAAYLPLDPDYPADRLRHMITAAGAALVVTAARPQTDLPGAGNVDLDDAAIHRLPATAPEVPVHPDRLAYVVFTSGSTGTPKGAGGTDRNLRQLYAGWDAAYRLSAAPDTWLNLTSVSFDVFTGDLVRALVSGGTLAIAPAGLAADPDALAEYVRAQRISAFEVGPAVLSPLLDHLEAASVRLPGLRRLIVTTDVAHGALLDRARTLLPETTLHTAYGLTETSIDSTHLDTTDQDLLPAGRIPVGRPLPGSRIQVLDEWLRPAPIGVTGEVYIGGSGLARGYLDRPDLTAERFVPDPLAADGTRLYRTGDLARWRRDGTLDFVGRTDQQINLRGYRVEPAEIEAALSRLDEVAEAAVAAQHAPDGDTVLVAYLVVTAGHEATGSAGLRETLRGMLPEHMVPATFVVVDRLPRTPTGKLDRGALPALEWKDAARDRTTPGSPSEQILADIWADVLRTDQVGIHEDFFDLGGHSLLATQAVARARAMLEVDVPVAALFEHPTVAGLARAIANLERSVTPPIEPVGRDRPLPLSFAQQRLWFLHLLEPDSSEYNVVAPVRLVGELDHHALTGALSRILERHEVLRTRFVALDGVPVQVIEPAARSKLPLVDVSGHSDPSAEAGRLVAADAETPFDLENGPVIRVRLIRIAEDDHVLALTLHHIVCDEWSAGLLREELSASYAELRAGRPALPGVPAIQYADYAHWQRERLTGETLDGPMAYWRAQLATAPILELPTDHPRPAVRDPSKAAAVEFTINGDTLARVRTLTRSHNGTLFMALLAAFQAVLARYSGQDDITIGTPIAGRTHPATEALIGFFVNTLAIRTRLDGDPTFDVLLERVRTACLDAYNHQEVPFERIVEELAPARDRSRNPLFNVMFTLDTPQGGESVTLPGLQAEGFDPCHTVAQFDLSLTLTEHADGLAGVVEYSTELFQAASVEQLARHFTRLVQQATASPQQRLSRLELLDPAERAQLLTGFNPAGVPVGDRPVHEVVAGHARTSPDRTAVVAEDGRLTYLELDAAANRLAHHLRALGAGPGAVVGIHLSRGVGLPLAFLAVLRSGAAYLPLDPAYPAERLSHMLTDTDAALVITSSVLGDALDLGHPTRRLHLDRVDLTAYPASAPAVHVHPDQPAYVIYTSGSTGQPKGTIGTHHNLSQLVAGWRATPLLDGVNGWLTLASISFDVFTGDMLRALTTGGTLTIAPDRLLSDPAALADHITARGITAFETGSAIVPLLDHLEGSGTPLPGLELLLVYSDLFDTTQLRRARRLLPDTAVYTAYGLTESSIDSTHLDTRTVEVPPGARIPVGRPLPGSLVYVLDPHLQPAPVGVVGEIYVGGPALTTGYLHRPELTAHRFVPSPFSHDGTRLYRTGDLARWCRDGTLQFLGRNDNQINLRGHRIEPAEIERALTELSFVESAGVTVQHTPDGQNSLSAFVVSTRPDTDGELARELKAALRDRLPGIMVPSQIVLVDALPETPNGKLDRAALAALAESYGRPGARYEPPATPTEETIAGIWAELLGVDRVGRDDDFFDLGGHSLMAARVLARLRAALDMDLAVSVLFEATTVTELAAAIDVLQWATSDRTPAADDEDLEEMEL